MLGAPAVDDYGMNALMLNPEEGKIPLGHVYIDMQHLIDDSDSAEDAAERLLD